MLRSDQTSRTEKGRGHIGGVAGEDFTRVRPLPKRGGLDVLEQKRAHMAKRLGTFPSAPAALSQGFTVLGPSR